MNKSKHKGVLIVPDGSKPEPHELEAVAVLLASGLDVTFIVPTRTAAQKTPDIEMSGVQWEMKTPMGKAKNTIFNAMKRGAKQSKYLIIDLRRTAIGQDKALKDIRTSMDKSSSIQRVKVINKHSDIIDIS